MAFRFQNFLWEHAPRPPTVLHLLIRRSHRIVTPALMFSIKFHFIRHPLETLPKSGILTPKSYDDHPRQVKYGSPPPGASHQTHEKKMHFSSFFKIFCLSCPLKTDYACLVQLLLQWNVRFNVVWCKWSNTDRNSGQNSTFTHFQLFVKKWSAPALFSSRWTWRL